MPLYVLLEGPRAVIPHDLPRRGHLMASAEASLAKIADESGPSEGS